MERMDLERTKSGYGNFAVAQHEYHWCVFDLRRPGALPVECFMSRTAALMSAESMFRNEQIRESNRSATQESGDG